MPTAIEDALGATEDLAWTLAAFPAERDVTTTQVIPADTPPLRTVALTDGKAVMLGGAFDRAKHHARCYRRNDSFGAGLANRRTGFRCCGD